MVYKTYPSVIMDIYILDNSSKKIANREIIAEKAHWRTARHKFIQDSCLD